MSKKTTVTIIIDGMGESEDQEGNAMQLACIPNLDTLKQKYPNILINTSGLDVGLPEGQMGNSEIGFNTINYGRILPQKLTKINKLIEDGDFFSNEKLKEAIKIANDNNKKIHLIGMISDGGVHSHSRHLYAILEMCKRQGMDKNVFIHAIMDGKDTEATKGEYFIQKLENKIEEKSVGKISSIIGRSYAMVEEKNDEKIKKAYDLMIHGKAEKSTNIFKSIEESYQKEIFDEFIEPIVMTYNDLPIGKIEEDDVVIFFNFKTDRMIELTKAICNNNDNINIKAFCFNDSYKYIKNITPIFEEIDFKNSLFEIIEKNNKKNIIIEEEKELSAEESIEKITDRILEIIDNEEYDSVFVKFSKLNQIGHKGDFEKVIKTLETLDKSIGIIAKKILKKDGNLIITSTHGNIEKMTDLKTGELIKSNTLNPVILMVISNHIRKIDEGKMMDIAPTILKLMNIEIPKEMTGKSLI